MSFKNFSRDFNGDNFLVLFGVPNNLGLGAGSGAGSGLAFFIGNLLLLKLLRIFSKLLFRKIFFNWIYTFFLILIY